MMPMQRKTAIALGHFRDGRLQEAFSIFKGFRLGFTPEERRSIQIAHEALAGNSAFYASLGIDTEAEIEQSKQIITKKYQ